MSTGRPTFPGRSARLGAGGNKRLRVRSSQLQLNTDSLEVGENASRAINCFYKMVGSDSDEEEEKFHGFSDSEIRLAGLKSKLVESQAAQCREDIWTSKGVVLDPEERANIRRHSVEGGDGEISKEDIDPTQVSEANTERVQLPSEEPEFAKEDKAGSGSVPLAGRGVDKYKKLVQKLVTQGPRKLKSESSDNRSETGSERTKRPKKVVGIKKILNKKLTGKKNSKSVSSDSEEEFHGFTDSEIETASLKSDRSLINGNNSKKTKKSKQNKLQPVPKTNKKLLDQSEEVSTESDVKEKDLIVSGRRKWKPSLKVQENNKKRENKIKTPKKVSDENKSVSPGTGNLQTSVKDYATAVSTGEENEDGKNLKQIKQVLKSQWSGRGQKSEEKSKAKPAKVIRGKVVLKESVLDIGSKGTNVTEKIEKFYSLDESLLTKLLKTGLNKFCEKVQKSIRGRGKFPPIVKDLEQNSVNPIGCALVEKNCKVKTRKFEGNIICGVCGDWAYCRDVRKSKYLGSFLCSPCRSFIQEKCREQESPPLLCPRGKNEPECLILRGREKCPACWLGLCLRVCQLDQDTRQLLLKLLGASADKLLQQTGNSGGQIRFCVGPVPVSKPIFDKKEDETPCHKSDTSSSLNSEEILKLDEKTNPRPKSSSFSRKTVVHEWLTNGWSKKALRRSHGKWVVYLLSPDMKILKNKNDLNIYIAKNAAIVDSNVINFSLPKKTALMESELSALESKKTESENPSDMDKSDVQSVRSSKRASKIPQKFSDFTPNKGSIFVKTKSPGSEPDSAGGETSTSSTPVVRTIKIKRSLSPEMSNSGRSRNSSSSSSRRCSAEQGERYRCDDCDKCFKKKSHLDEHLLIHAGEKPFKCEKCGWSFRRNDKLRKHMETCNYVNREHEYSTFIRTGKVRSVAGLAPEVVVGGTGSGRWEEGLYEKEREAAKPRRGGADSVVAHSSRPAVTPEVVEEEETKDSSAANKTKWRNGVPPSYWVWGRYICEVCKKDCGYANNLGLHRKRTHGLHYRQERLGYNGEIVRGTRISQTPTQPKSLKRKLEVEKDSDAMDTPVVKKFMSKAMPCFECKACKNPDCMKCKWCHDKKKYGGPGRLNKRCITRRCTNPNVVEMQDHLKTRGMRMQAQAQPPVRTTYVAGGLVKQMPCRNCATCIMEDCGKCRPCLDKRKFGGPGKMNKRCKMKVCLTPKDLGDPSTVPTSYIRRQPDFVSSKFTTGQDTPNLDISFEDEDDSINQSRAQSPDCILPDTKESLEDFIEMGLEGVEQSNMINNISLTEFELQRSPTKAVKTLPVSSERLSPSKCRVAVEFWSGPDSEEGAGVLSDQLTVKDLCWLCGSAGQAKMLHCVSCCQPFHYFCLAEDEVPRSAEEEERWQCGQCVRCQVCAGLGAGQDSRSCTKCGNLFHSECLPLATRDPGPDWLCGSCLKCEGCGAPGQHSGNTEQLCRNCCQAKIKGSYCPLCKGCYKENDYDQAMMSCADCGGWIHAQCEGIDGEEYQVLSLLPDDVEYRCKVCKSAREGPAGLDWREAVASEIRKGQQTIVSSLLQHRNSRYFQHDFLHAASKQRSDQEIRNEDEKSATAAFSHKATVTENLNDDSSESWDWDGDSVVSLTCSLPSSWSTDPGPSLFSYSSYETQEPCNQTAMPSIEVSNDKVMKSCGVDPRNMSTYSWLGPNKKTIPTKQECKNSDHTDTDILDFSEIDFSDENPNEIIEENDVDYAVEFNELKQLVQGCGFSSILDLHLNISKIIEKTPVDSEDCESIKSSLRSDYLSVLQETFPWFLTEDPARYWSQWEPDCPRSSQRDFVVKPPNGEHSYASRKRKASTCEDSESIRGWERIDRETELEDGRKCILCGVTGEEEERVGRLLPYRFSEWIHLSCALWSSEVYETVDGSLAQVVSAVTRSRNLLCTVCHQRGATIGCCHADCSANFHFLCGIQAKADFKEDKTVYCYKHAQKYASKENVASFEGERFIWLDADPEEEKSRPGKHKSKFMDYRNLKFSSGALRIDSLGSLVLASDTEKALVPVGFSATKSFWSALNPRKMTKYKCTTRLVQEMDENDSKNQEQNIVIDHSNTDKEECEKLLRNFRKFVVSKELEENVEDLMRSDSIISPSKVSKLWSWLDYKQIRDPPAEVEPRPRTPEPRSPPTSALRTPQSFSSPNRTDRGPRLGSGSPLKLNKAVAVFRSPAKLSLDQELFYSDEDSGDDLSLRREEFQVQQVWFNANRMLKVREITTQTSEYYDEVQIASNNVYCNSNPPPRSPPPPPPLPDSCEFLDGLNLLEQADLLTDSAEPFDLATDLLNGEEGESNSSDDILSYVTNSLELGEFGQEQMVSKIMRMERSESRLTSTSSIPQLDGGEDDEMLGVKQEQRDGSTDDEQIVVVDDEEDNIKQEVTPAKADLEAVLCSCCGNTFPSKKCYEGHTEQCPAMAARADRGETEASPRKDFSILGLLKQEDMKTEAPEEKAEEDIMIISESISNPGSSSSGSRSTKPASSVQYLPPQLPPQLPYSYPAPVIQYPYTPYSYLPVGGYIAVPPLQPIYYSGSGVSPYLQPAYPQPPLGPPQVSQPPPQPPVTSIAPLQTSSRQPNQPPPRKVARVQPTPHIVRPIATKAAPPAHRSPGIKADPMAALSSLSKNPVAHHTDLAPTDLSISHRNLEHIKHQKKLHSKPGKTVAPVPQNWRSVSPKQEVIEVESGSCSPASVWGDHEYCSSPEPDSLSQQARSSLSGVNITTKSSRSNSIKFVLQSGDNGDGYKIKEVTVKDGTKSKATINPKTANKALKAKARSAKRPVKKLKSAALVVPVGPNGEPYHAQSSFVNELEVGGEATEEGCATREEVPPHKKNSSEPYILYSLSSEDGGVSLSGRNITQLWQAVYECVSTARTAHQMSALPSLQLGPSGEDMLGLTHTALRYLLEQVPGARTATKYQWKHQQPPPTPQPIKENPSGCARSEGARREKKPYDMFAWLSSRLRKKPHPNVGFRLPPEIAAEAHMMEGSSRRATSLDLPMAMRYRQLAKNAKEAVAVYASGIHGRGLFCKREISAGEMVIEYCGEQIRSILTDYREKYYDDKGIGCYMFKVDDDVVLDATVKGNAARFINHSCEPNCYSKIVDIIGRKHIIIFAMRKIFPGEELTYDYKFPKEEEKLKCHCGSRKCKKFMN